MAGRCLEGRRHSCDGLENDRFIMNIRERTSREKMRKVNDEERFS